MRYTITVTRQQLIAFGRWPEYELVCHLNDELRRKNAPWVVEPFLSPDLWREKVLKLYQSISMQVLPTTEAQVYTFTLEESHENH